MSEVEAKRIDDILNLKRPRPTAPNPYHMLDLINSLDSLPHSKLNTEFETLKENWRNKEFENTINELNKIFGKDIVDQHIASIT